MTQPDYIILGAGASGLQLAYRFAMDDFFADKHILIIDKAKNKGNDRTWSFWEEGKGEWDDILQKTWNTIYFGSKHFSKHITIEPYQYKMLRSEAYYNKLWKVINAATHINFLHAEVLGISTDNDITSVSTTKGDYKAYKIFNSLPLNNDYKTQHKYPILQQHFVGWFITTDKPVFNTNVATFMDFDIPQYGNTRFMYVLPTSTTEALFEYTLFSKDLLELEVYEAEIKAYLQARGITNYTINEVEKGSIPMTSFKFHKYNSEHVLHIGTIGGWTKASTGYTFMNINKQTKRLITFLKHSNDLSRFTKTGKFWYYDLLMLDVLATDNAFGAQLFSSLFKRLKVATLFRFLDEETSISEDLKIMVASPPIRFIKALFKRLFTAAF